LSGQSHWNPATEPDKAERPDMSGMGADMSGQSLWNPARMLDMSGLTGVFGGVIDFGRFALQQLTECIPFDSTELFFLFHH
jgi:hypothetical protein